jgi:hypothetical protein
MAAIVGSIEIARRPEDVFAYATDSSRFPEWQASVVSVRQEGPGPLAVGSRAVVTRRLGRRTVPGTKTTFRSFCTVVGVRLSCRRH